MAELQIYADDLSENPYDADLVKALVEVVRELLPDKPQNLSIDPGSVEVAAQLESVTIVQAERFVSRIVELSRTSGHSFTINTTFNDEENRAHIQRDPNYLIVDGSVIHVRPTEGPVLHAYFQYLFTAL
jgi:hypothetical protein